VATAAQGPLMLEMGVLPDVAAATAATMIMFTSASASAVYIGFGTVRSESSLAQRAQSEILTSYDINLLKKDGVLCVIKASFLCALFRCRVSFAHCPL